MRPEPQPSEQQSEFPVPKLFTLPAEIQTMIYAVIEPTPIQLRIWSIRRIGNRTDWPIDVCVRDKRTPSGRPAILETCKYVCKFVAPIYFFGNTFSTTTTFGNRNVWNEKYSVLRFLWGEDIKHIRHVIDCSRVGLVYQVFHYASLPGKWKKEIFDVTTNVKLLPGGTLVMSRQSGGAPFLRGLERGAELCRCLLETVAATSSTKGRDSRRMFEIVAVCAFESERKVEAKICSRCGRPCFVITERIVREVAAGAEPWEVMC